LADSQHAHLKKGDWKALVDEGKITFDELTELWDIVWDKERKARPALLKKSPAKFEAQVMRVFRGRLRRKMQLQLVEGELTVIGVSLPSNYIDGMIQKCYNMYHKDPENAVDEGYIEVRTDDYGEEELVPLDYRATYSSGKDNTNFGTDLREMSGYMFSVLAVWTPYEKKGPGDSRFEVFTIGGESGDEEAKPVCPHCGEVNLATSLCPHCGGKNNQYLFPVFWGNRYKTFRAFVVEIHDDDDELARIVWNSSSRFEELLDEPDLSEFLPKVKGYRPDPKKPAMSGWKQFSFTSKTIEAWHKQNKKAKRSETAIPGIYICDLRQRNPRVNKKGNRTIQVEDENMAFMQDGKITRPQRVFVPEHIWNDDIRDEIDVDSMIIVTGTVDRWNAYDFKTRKQIPNKLADPHIEAWGCYGVPEFVKKPANAKPIPPEKPAKKKSAKKSTKKASKKKTSSKKVAAKKSAKKKKPEPEPEPEPEQEDAAIEDLESLPEDDFL